MSKRDRCERCAHQADDLVTVRFVVDDTPVVGVTMCAACRNELKEFMFDIIRLPQDPHNFVEKMNRQTAVKLARDYGLDEAWAWVRRCGYGPVG